MAEQRLSPSGSEYLRGTATIPAVAIGAGATSAITATVTGAQANRMAWASPRTALDAGLVLAWCRVSAANTVEIGVANFTAAGVTPAAAITVDLLAEPPIIE